MQWASSARFLLCGLLCVTGTRSDLSDLSAKVKALVAPVVADCDAVLVDLELAGTTNSHRVRVLVHRDCGITIDACERISRELADVLDVEDPFPGRYRLEVTSPGLDRPLSTDQDFSRARSRRVKVVLESGKTLVGRLQDWTESHIEIDTSGGREDVSRGDIAKATIEAEF